MHESMLAGGRFRGVRKEKRIQKQVPSAEKYIAGGRVPLRALDQASTWRPHAEGTTSFRRPCLASVTPASKGNQLAVEQQVNAQTLSQAPELRRHCGAERCLPSRGERGGSQQVLPSVQFLPHC